MFMGEAIAIVEDPNSTVVVNGAVDLKDLQKEINRVNTEQQNQGPSFEDSIEVAAKQSKNNPLAATARQSFKPEKAKMNEKDNLLKYQISDDKEENELLEVVMGPSVEEMEAMTGTMKRKVKEGTLISTEQLNKTSVVELDFRDHY